MKKLIRIILPCILFLSTTAQAQKTGSISGFLMDSTANASIPGAVVEVSNVKDTLQKKYASSGYKGSFEIKGLSYGEYNLRISFLGYHDIRQTIRVNKPTLNLGTLYLVQASQRIDDIVLEVQALRTSQKGDTVVYNADAFKVTQDADAENLLSKMPGITVLDGEVEAQGETVKKVFVDGKEFFGGDVTSAIKNLPAEVIEKIEVYNKLSDRAEFTGIDDGEGYKAINLVTKVQSGQFGKLNVGYGFNDKYIGGGNLNFFKGDTRISLIGMTNNINQQNFAMEDLLGVVSSGRGMQSRGGGHMRGMRGSGSFLMRPQDGISTVTSFGVNYSDVWAKKVEVSASYFFNKTRNENEKITDRQYYSDTEAYRTYDNTSNSESKNYEHRFNARIEYKINDNQTLMIRPQASFQDYDSYNSGYGLNNEIAGSTTTLINELTNLTESKNFGYNLSNSIFYRLKLGKPGRTLMVDASGGANKNDRKGLNSTLQQNLPVLDSLFKQRTITNSNGYNLSGSVNYTEPLSEKSQLSLQYRISYSYSDADKEAFLWDRALEQFNPNFDEDYSNIYNSGYLTQRVGPGFNHSNEGNILVANVYYQKSSLIGNQDYPTPPQKIKASFDNFLYFAMLDRSFSSTSRMRLMARSYTSNPSVFQLQDVVDMSNSQFVTAGNSRLDPSYTHSVFFNYIKSSVTKGQTFMVMGGFNAQNNYIADSTVMLQRGETYLLPNGERLENGAQFTRPVNMDGKWSVNGSTSFGTPIGFLKSNINFNIGAMYSESPSYINGNKNILKGQYYNAGVILSSNISEKIDFTLSYNGGYNIAQNTIQEDRDNTYFSQGASARFKWVAWAGFTLTGNVNYSQYKGITDDFNEEYVICNLYVGKKLFRNQRGELTFGVNDLLNQNTSFSRNITDTYIENVVNNTLGRYFSIQFTYNLRSYKGKSSSSGNGAPDSLGSPDHRRPGGGGRPPMGPPPGGGGRFGPF